LLKAEIAGICFDVSREIAQIVRSFMRLMDQVLKASVCAKSPLVVNLSDEIGNATIRYVLTPDVVAICESLVSDHFDMLSDMTDIVRVGEESMWIERHSELADADGVHRRIGLLVEADCDGRSGTITVAIEIPGQPPLVMPHGIAFDFDGNIALSCDGLSQFRITDFASDATRKLASCFAIRLLPGWREYYSLDSRSPEIRKEIMDELARSAMPDGLFLMAFTALLMSRKSFREVPSQLGRLNRARARSGKLELLDHLEVMTHVIAGDHVGSRSLASERRPSRMHHVRGHFVRRGPLLYWRSAHFRGDPDRMIMRKTVTLNL
jgi:hypothetical protein